MKAAIIPTLGLLALGACVTSPRDIAPALSPTPQASISCPTLRADLSSSLSHEWDLERAQTSTRRNDIVGIALVGLPLGRMAGGNQREAIALNKGHMLSLAAAIRERC